MTRTYEIEEHLFYQTIGKQIKMKQHIISGKKCVICNDDNSVTYVRKLIGHRTGNLIDLFFCTKCESFSNPSGYVESKEQLRKDLAWSIGVTDRNITYLSKLMKLIKKTTKNHTFKRVLEVGCSHGIALNELRDNYGCEVYGYDLNDVAINYGKEAYGLKNLYSQFWDSKIELPKIDLMLCISVMEHIENPRPLFIELTKAAKKHDSFLFISIPFVDREDWYHLLSVDTIKKKNPFRAADVHITFFSAIGFKMLADECGVKSIQEMTAGGWRGFLMKF